MYAHNNRCGYQNTPKIYCIAYKELREVYQFVRYKAATHIIFAQKVAENLIDDLCSISVCSTLRHLCDNT